VVGNYRLYLWVSLLLSFIVMRPAATAATAVNARAENSEEVCDPTADYYLGMEDYPEAIRRHLLVIARHPDSALAHYHLGFAYGMLGDHKAELVQYRDAIDLGLSDWALFLNLGLLYFENHDLVAATNVLRLATLLGPERPETHLNLGLVYERRGLLGPAEQEVLLSLQLDPEQADALNTLGVIYAEQGDYGRAREQWNELLRTRPEYEPARANLKVLDRAQRSQIKTSFSHTR
jgi:tetratricopeptide (TPR) repeat protein